jgi:hypothetical protein
LRRLPTHNVHHRTRHTTHAPPHTCQSSGEGPAFGGLGGRPELCAYRDEAKDGDPGHAERQEDLLSVPLGLARAQPPRLIPPVCHVRGFCGVWTKRFR